MDDGGSVHMKFVKGKDVNAIILVVFYRRTKRRDGRGGEG